MKVYVYKESGMYDCDSFNNIEIFQTWEKAQEYFKKQVENEKLAITNHNFDIVKDWDTAEDGEFLITDDTESCFSGFEFGYSNDYSISIEIMEMECK